MRSVLRVGAIAAIVGCVAVYGLARVSALVAAYGILLLGFAAGLAMAKWLDWSLYGRQLESGAQAGAIACIPAAAVAIVALISQNPHSITAVETASHLGPVNAAGFAHAFAFAGWAAADVLSVGFATLFAIGLAALTSIVMGWSKSGRAVRSVSQAYEAARSLRAGAWSPGGTTAVPAVQGATTAMPAWQGAQPTSAPRGESGLAWPQGTTVVTAVPPAAPYVPPPSVTFPGSGAGQSTVPPAPSANSPADDTQLRAAMREALAMWGDESGEHEAGPPDDSSSANNTPANGKGNGRSRAPHASQFLNDAKKRGRKKADTRDWLC